MNTYPIKKLILIYGWHLDRIQTGTGLNSLLSLLTKESFTVTQEISELGILVYMSPKYTDKCKITHAIINFENIVSEMRFCKTKLD